MPTPPLRGCRERGGPAIESAVYGIYRAAMLGLDPFGHLPGRSPRTGTHPRAMTLRTAEHRDLQALLALYRQLNPDDPALHPERATTIWKGILENDTLRVFVVEVDGEVVATCTLAVIPNLTRAGRSYGLIENVVTARAHRRLGHGSALLRHALEHAWSRGCYKVMLLTGSTRAETFRFYESVGFLSDRKRGMVAYPAAGAGSP